MKRIDFSVVMITYYRHEILKLALDAVLRAEYALGNIEIILVDNDVNQSAKVVSANRRVKYLVEPRRGPAYARNKGISHAKYNQVVLLDDDVVIAKDYFDKCYEVLTTNPGAVVVGNSRAVHLNNKDFSYWREVLKDDLWLLGETFFPYSKQTILKPPWTAYAANMCLNKDHVGKPVFDQRYYGRMYANRMLFAEDHELCWRLHMAGEQIIYEPKMIVKHIITDQRLTWRYIFRRLVNLGIELRLVDNHYKSKKTYRPYSVTFKSLSSIFQMIKHILIGFGYYILAPQILVNEGKHGR